MSKNINGVLCTLPSDINHVFTSHDMVEFLNSLKLPSLSTSQATQLDAHITLKEFKEALDSMPKSKSPGLDGIPPELISELWYLVGPILLDSMNFSIKIVSFHWDQKSALISSFKKG